MLKRRKYKPEGFGTRLEDFYFMTQLIIFLGRGNFKCRAYAMLTHYNNYILLSGYSPPGEYLNKQLDNNK